MSSKRPLSLPVCMWSHWTPNWSASKQPPEDQLSNCPSAWRYLQRYCFGLWCHIQALHWQLLNMCHFHKIWSVGKTLCSLSQIQGVPTGVLEASIGHQYVVNLRILLVLLVGSYIVQPTCMCPNPITNWAPWISTSNSGNLGLQHDLLSLWAWAWWLPLFTGLNHQLCLGLVLSQNLLTARPLIHSISFACCNIKHVVICH